MKGHLGRKKCQQFYNDKCQHLMDMTSVYYSKHYISLLLYKFLYFSTCLMGITSFNYTTKRRVGT